MSAPLLIGLVPAASATSHRFMSRGDPAGDVPSTSRSVLLRPVLGRLCVRESFAYGVLALVVGAVVTLLERGAAVQWALLTFAAGVFLFGGAASHRRVAGEESVGLNVAGLGLVLLGSAVVLYSFLFTTWIGEEVLLSLVAVTWIGRGTLTMLSGGR